MLSKENWEAREREQSSDRERAERTEEERDSGVLGIMGKRERKKEEILGISLWPQREDFGACLAVCWVEYFCVWVCLENDTNALN